MRRGFLLAACWLVCLPVMANADADFSRLDARYRAMLETNPQQDIALNRLWSMHASAKGTEALLESYRKAMRKNPRAAVVLAKLLQKAGRPSEALEVLKDAAKKIPPVADVFVALAVQAQNDGDWGQCSDWWEKALGAMPLDFPDRVAALIAWGEALHRAGHAAEGLAAWEQAAILAPNNYEMHRKLAQAYQDAGNTVAARRHWEKLANAGAPEGRMAALHEISALSEKAGNFEEAIAAENSLLAILGPGHWEIPDTRKRLVHLHQAAGKLELLKMQWLAGAENPAADSESALALVDFFAVTGDMIAERKWLKEAARRAGPSSLLWERLAELSVTAGEYAEALVIYDAMLGTQSSDDSRVFRSAELSILSGNPDAAVHRIESLMKSKPDDAVLESRAMDFFKLQRLDAAVVAQLEGKITENPQNAEAVLELAHYQVLRRQYPKVHATLERLDYEGIRLESRAAIARDSALILQECGEPANAVIWARRAFEAAPKDSAQALLLIEVLQSIGDMSGVLDILKRTAAAENSDTGVSVELDRKYFSILSSSKGVLSGGSSRGNGVIVVTSRSHGVPDNVSQEVRNFSSLLKKEAVSAGSANAALRLARWLEWSGDTGGALVVLRSGIKASPQSIPLHEALVEFYLGQGDPGSAIETLQVISSLAPDRRPAIDRRIAQLEMDRGNLEPALHFFAKVVDEQQGAWQSLVDLATAEQRASNWFSAAKTWERAFAAATPAQKMEMHQAMLGAFDRTQLFRRGLDLLVAAAMAQTSRTSQADVLKEAATYASQHGLGDVFLTNAQEKLRLDPGNFAWNIGLSHWHKIAGEPEKARTALQSVQNLTSESETTGLLESAEENGDFLQAAGFASKLADKAQAGNATAWLKYVELLEKSQQREATADMWKKISEQFPRDPEVQQAAAVYFERTGDVQRSRAALRAAALLGPSSPEVWLKLGDAAFAGGDREKAFQDYQSVLDTTRAASDVRMYPWPLGTGKSAVPLPEPNNEEGCRLLAIQRMARVLSTGALRMEWLQKWSEASSPGQRIWAMAAVGDSGGALDGLRSLIKQNPRDVAATECFLARALYGNQGERISSWIKEDPMESRQRAETFLSVLAKVLNAGIPIRGDVLERLGGGGGEWNSAMAWRIAELLAAHDLVRAIAIARPALPHLPGYRIAEAAVALAGWQLSLRDIPSALETLDAGLIGGDRALSFNNAIFSLLRMRWVLTPRNERKDFSMRFLKSSRTREWPAFYFASEILLEGLSGNHDEVSGAASKLTALVASGDFDAGSLGELVNSGGVQLESWNLHRVAKALYKAVRNLDPAELVLEGHGTDLLEDAANRFVICRLALAAPIERAYLLNEWQARGLSDEELHRFALELEASGYAGAALSLHAMSADRNQPAIFWTLMRLLLQKGNRQQAIKLMTKIAAAPPAGTSRSEVFLQAAKLFAEWGDFQEALNALRRMKPYPPNDSRALLGEAELCGRLGLTSEEYDARRAIYPQKPSAETLCLYAESAVKAGMATQARKPVEEGYNSHPDWRPLILEMMAKNIPALGSFEDFSLKAQSLIQSGSCGVALRAIQALPNQQRLLAGELLAAAAVKAISQEERYFCAEQLLRLDSGKLSSTEILERLDTLGKLAAGKESLQFNLYAFKTELAVDSAVGETIQEKLREDWKTGDSQALIALLRAHGTKPEEVEKLLADYIASGKSDKISLIRLGKEFASNGRHKMAADTYRKLLEGDPGNPVHAFLLAGELWQCGQRPQALALLDPYARMRSLDKSLIPPLAEFFLNVNRLDRAGALLREMKESAFSPKYRFLFEKYAAELNRRGRSKEAGEFAGVESYPALPDSP